MCPIEIGDEIIRTIPEQVAENTERLNQLDPEAIIARVDSEVQEAITEADIPSQVSSAITEADIPSQVSDAIDDELSRTSLWTNADPSSSFAAQSISIADLQSYSYIFIKYRVSSTNTVKIEMFGTVAGSEALDYIAMPQLDLVSREFSISSGSISFADSYVSTGLGTPAVNNATMIPLEIIGIDL